MKESQFQKNAPTGHSHLRGKRIGNIMRRCFFWEHSHLRGKKDAKLNPQKPLLGTLPLAWEKVSAFKRTTNTYQEHSHLRGKKREWHFLYAAIGGTLPLAWEKDLVTSLQMYPSRNTPTCVGKSSLIAFYEAGMEEHSHLRGKKDTTIS